MENWWTNYPWRVIQPNFREIDTLDFDEDRFLAELKDFSCSAVMLNAAGLIASYDTKLAEHTKSAYLGGFDLRRLVERCREAGMPRLPRQLFELSKTHTTVGHLPTVVCVIRIIFLRIMEKTSVPPDRHLASSHYQKSSQ